MVISNKKNGDCLKHFADESILPLVCYFCLFYFFFLGGGGGGFALIILLNLLLFLFARESFHVLNTRLMRANTIFQL